MLGVCQLVCQATALAQFHVHVILQLLKIKSLKRKQGRKHGYFAITKLAILSQKVKCSGRHLVRNNWWHIHSLLWFMQPTGRRDHDRVKLHDILIVIITGNADSLKRVWCGGGGGGGGGRIRG